MKIANLWFTQRKLKRAEQIDGLACYFIEGNYLYDDPVELQECEDGEIEIVNGHHRIAAMWLSGLDELLPGEYNLHYAERSKGRFWQVKDVEKYIQRIHIRKNAA